MSCTFSCGVPCSCKSTLSLRDHSYLLYMNDLYAVVLVAFEEDIRASQLECKRT